MQNKNSRLQLDVQGAFKHTSTCNTKETMDLVIRLIQKDADKHHLFFNDKGFHNHLVHQLLADYSLGATGPRLEKAYRDNAVYQRPKKPLKSGFIWNSANCLGNEDYYPAYVIFFQEEIAKRGAKPCIEHYIFEQDAQLGLYSRFLSGVYHPMIHLGYGIEFNHSLMLAEGLAWVMVHQPRAHHFFEPLKTELASKNKTDSSPTTPMCRSHSLTEGLSAAFIDPADKPQDLGSSVKASALEIIQSIQTDTRLDGLVKWLDEDKFATVIHTIPDLLHEYCQQWPVSESLDGSLGLRTRATELQILAAVMHAGTHRPGQEIMLDFFLMHTLTSSLFLHAYIELLQPPHAASLLRGKFAADLIYYIAHGRPDLNLKQFKSYPKLLPWDKIIAKAIASEDDHVPKAVRALIHASRYDKTQSLSLETYQAMASLTVDDDLCWSTDAIGFDEAWQANKNKNLLANTRITHV